MSFVTDGECIESQKHIIQQNIKSLAIMKTFRFFAMALAAALTFAACNPEEKKDDGKLYRITVTAGENGTATASRTEAEAGDNITLTATPADGFAFEAWTVTSGNASVADATAASTTFTMPAGDVAISAAFVKAGSDIDDTEDIRPQIKDQALKAYIEMRLGSIEKIENTTYPAWDKNGDGKLTAKEAAAVQAMNLEVIADDIVSLEDLKWFTGLEVLIMNGVLAESGQEYLSELPKLKVFKAENAALGELDFSGCADLNTVVCGNSYLDKIDVSTCSQLVELDIWYTEVKELDLSACSQLQYLNIRITDISKLDVSHCSKLVKLDANSCEELSELSLPQNSSLTSLAVGNSKITGFDPTPHTKLTYLSFGNNSEFKGDFDLSKCSELKTLICSYTPIKSLDVSGLKKLQEIYATACSLEEIDMSGCSNLWWIELDHNNLSYIDVTGLMFKNEVVADSDDHSFYAALGAQVEPGTEPSFEQLNGPNGGGESDDLAWAGYKSNKNGYDWGAHGVKPRTVHVVFDERHREYWEVMASKLPCNSTPDANFYIDEGRTTLKYKYYPEGEVIDLSHIEVEFLN